MGALFGQNTLSSSLELKGFNILAMLHHVKFDQVPSKVHPSLLCNQVVEAHQVVVILEGVQWVPSSLTSDQIKVHCSSRQTKV